MSGRAPPGEEGARGTYAGRSSPARRRAASGKSLAVSRPAWAQNEKHRSKCCGGHGIAYHGVPGKRPLLRSLGRDWRNPDPCGISISMGPSAREFTNSLKSLAGAEVAPGW